MSKKIFFISLILSFFYSNANSYEINSKYSKIKGDYLISYYTNAKSDLKTYDITPSIFYYKGYIYNIIWQDFLTNNRPIDTYEFHIISKNTFKNTIRYFHDLAKSNPKFGSYTNNPMDYLIIEGSYKKNPFIIKISDPSNKYISENVSSFNLLNRENVIKKLYQHFNKNKAIIFTPQSYTTLYKIANINEDTSYFFQELDIDIKPGCYNEKFLVSDYNGIFKIKSSYKNFYYDITSKPNLIGLNICE